ncbi:hypothetical protein [Oryzicola mucosus]|uniref:Uncharacterized protein n=1 Tax=Oryzicola mucosus TaxID=2767425 RepID=A0A8J6PYH6_9HYPH|nr:hypothetical protein [Oryzicola mucosus]MBD0416522.1 hypothetical protein [Oryzicola mucosus]
MLAYDQQEYDAGYQAHKAYEPVPGDERSPSYRWGWVSRRKDASGQPDEFDEIRKAAARLQRRMKRGKQVRKKKPAPLPKPAIRVDGGRRVNLKAKRAGIGMAVGKAPEPKRTGEQLAADRHRSAFRVRKLKKTDGGAEGSVVTKVNARLGSTRHIVIQTLRSKPGTFERRYGKKQLPQFHAGSYLARLYERAGIAIASSADFLRGTSSGYKTGLPDGRVAAIDALHGFHEDMGREQAQRLIDYCVVGLTSFEIAKKHGEAERDMAKILDRDLKDCAICFKMLGKHG